MIDKNAFRRAIATTLNTIGFVKKGGQSWYLQGKDSIIVFNLQKSDWDETYYINIGVWVKALGESLFPLHNQCHLVYRVENLFPKQRELIIKGYTLEKSNINHLNKLCIFIESQLAPFVQECTNEETLKKLFSQGALENGLVNLAARRYLSNQ